MKHTLYRLSGILTICLSLTTVKQQAYAQSASGTPNRHIFECVIIDKVPITRVRHEWGDKPMFRWISHRGGLTPEERCKIVSSRLQYFYNQGLLKYIETGYENNHHVVCVVKYKEGPCQGILITLESESEAELVRQQIIDSGFLSLGLELGNSQPVYFDVEAFLNYYPRNSNTISNSPFTN